MKSILALQSINRLFKAHIFELSALNASRQISFYKANTSFGQMTFIVESFQSHHVSPKQQSKMIQQQIRQRNILLKQNKILTPLIFQQQVVRNSDFLFNCFTLTEPLQIWQSKNLEQISIQSIYENIINCAYHGFLASHEYSIDSYLLKRTFFSKHNKLFYLDFTTLRPSNNQSQDIFKIIKKSFCQHVEMSRKNKQNQILFIQDLPIKYNLSTIQNSKSWNDLILLLNLFPQQKVKTIGKNIKQVLLSSLNGIIDFQYKNELYQNNNFHFGFRMQGITQISFIQLCEEIKFFEKNMIYSMFKEKYMKIRKKHLGQSIDTQDANTNYEYQVEGRKVTDVVEVNNGITKAQFIFFIILYLRFLEPTLRFLKYHQAHNQLQIQIVDSNQFPRNILIRFHKEYIVKDEQISMIIQKSRLVNTKLYMQRMNCTDGLMMFLANSQKTSKISQLDCSYCSKITENGVSMLLASPFCKSLKKLSIRGLTIADTSSMKLNKLQDLRINECTQVQPSQIDLSKLSIIKLQAVGLNTAIKLPNTIRFLYLDTVFALQGLRQLQNLQLQELKLRINSNKNQITSFFSGIYNRQNPVRNFVNGACKKTLRYLDLSNSTIKLKQLKALFYLQTIQTVILQSIESDKFDELILPSFVTTLSLKNSKISYEIFRNLVASINIFIKLNVAFTDVSSEKLKILLESKKHISYLQLDETQLDPMWISKKDSIANISIHLQKLLRDQNAFLINECLLECLESSGYVNLVFNKKYQQNIQQKLNKFIAWLCNKYIKHQQFLKLNGSDFKPRNPEYISRYQNIRILNEQHNKRETYKQVLVMPSKLYFSNKSNDVNIEIFNVTLHNVIRKYPNSLLSVNIRGNRLLGLQAIHLLKQYASDCLRQLDFRDCLFTYLDAEKMLFKFMVLDQVNSGQYEINLGQKDDCQLYLQQIFKFFMKLKLSVRMKLTIRVKQLQNILFYNIMYDMIHHFSSAIKQLHIDFQNLSLEGSSFFWDQILSISKLQCLNITYNNYNFEQDKEDLSNFISKFQKLDYVDLCYFELNSNIQIFPSGLRSVRLQNVALIMPQNQCSQTAIYKFIKPLINLKFLRLQFQRCQNITSLDKISHALQKMAKLQILVLNFQNCSIKDSSIIDLIDRLKYNLLLQKLEINVNNTLKSVAELVKVCQMLVTQIKFCHVTVFALQNKKPLIQKDLKCLQSKGIQLILQ